MPLLLPETQEYGDAVERTGGNVAWDKSALRALVVSYMNSVTRIHLPMMEMRKSASSIHTYGPTENEHMGLMGYMAAPAREVKLGSLNKV